MRAILVSGNSQLSRGPGGARGILSPLVDRPFLQHVVESILSHGIREIFFVLAPADQPAQAMLGDGTRWGARFQYHVTTGKMADGFMEVAGKIPDEHVLLAQSDRLPLIQGDLKTFAPTLFCWREKKLNWSGWGVVRTADILCLPPGLEESEVFAALLENGGDMLCDEGRRALSARSYEDLVDANRRVLSREFAGLLVGGKEIQPGVWVSRNVKVHPTAKLRSPAFVGENTTVGAMVEVGPATSIGKNCMIERDTQVSDSIVFSGSYVGQHLALKSVVVDRSRLISTKWDAEIEGVDELLLGDVFGAPVYRQILRFCGRVVALLLLVLFSPVLLAVYLASFLGWVPDLKHEDVVSTPTVRDSYRWKTFRLWSFGGRQAPKNQAGWLKDFLFCFLPALVPIAAGHLSFVGNKTRNREEAVMATMTHDTAFLYSHTGYLQPSLFDNGAPASVEHAGGIGYRDRMRLLLQYAGSMLGISSLSSSPSPSSSDRGQPVVTGGSPYEN